MNYIILSLEYVRNSIYNDERHIPYVNYTIHKCVQNCYYLMENNPSIACYRGWTVWWPTEPFEGGLCIFVSL